MAEAVGVTLRAAQAWEAGGGIDDDHLPLLIEFLETDADYLLRGRTERGETPDPFASPNGSGPSEVQEQLAELAAKVDALLVLAGLDPNGDLAEQAAQAAEQAARATASSRRGSARGRAST
jgi:hypothetical protein